jgi:hypothetical protein
MIHPTPVDSSSPPPQQYEEKSIAKRELTFISWVEKVERRRHQHLWRSIMNSGGSCAFGFTDH